jgi:hypothetical protein
MVHSALRIEVIPFALALAFISWRVETAEAPVQEAPLQPAYSPRRVVGRR